MFYKCKHFRLYELVSREVFQKFGAEAWMFFSPLALEALDGVREFFDAPVIVNNWADGGPFSERGYRSRFSTVGGDYSQHRLGNGFDCDIIGASADKARTEILANKDDRRLMYINALEEEIPWVHLDCRNVSDRIRLVSRPSS